MKASANASAEQRQKAPLVIPWWGWAVVIFLVLFAGAAAGWFISGKLNDEYLQMNRLGPISLQPGAPEAWLIVDYPQMLSRTDQGVQQAKRIIVQLGLDPGSQDCEIALGIRPMNAGLRLLNANGDPVSSKIQFTVTQGMNPLVFYVEHTRVRYESPFSVVFELLPPTRGITVPHPVPASTFAIQEEAVWHQTLRKLLPPVSNLTTWLAGLWGLANMLVGPIKKRYAEMDKLYQNASKSVEQGEFEDYLDAYRQYRQLCWPRQTTFHFIVHTEFEKLALVAETRCRNVKEQKTLEQERKREEEKRKAELYEQMLKALEQDNIGRFGKYLGELKSLAPDHPDISLFETIRRLEAQHQSLKSNNKWSFQPSSDLDPSQLNSDKSKLEKALSSNEPVVRRWAARLLAHFEGDKEVGNRLRRLLKDDSSLDVRAEAAWGLSRQERSRAPISQLASPEQVEEWLKRFSFEYNPFSLITAEQEEKRWQDKHFVGHPAYDCLESSAGHTALFADAGCGKTSFRLQFKRHLQDDARALVVEYVDFSPWMPWDWNVIPSPRVHTERIVERAIFTMGKSKEVVPSHLSYIEQLEHLVDLARQNGYPGGVRVLVDNIDAGHDARQDSTVAEHLVRDLMDTWDMLTIDGLRFHFFLPLTLFEKATSYETCAAGLIEKIRAEWTTEQLRALLEQRLAAASNGKINSLNALAELLEGVEWDAIVTELANGSPRRLIRLVNLLFRHRAGVAGGEKIQAIDWACLYERFASGEI